jgi:hypothetical protein
MKTDYKRYRKVPPYMTKTGIQIGLLHQEPFESRIDEDAYKLQRALLKKKTYKYREPIHYGDLFIGIVSVIGIIAFILLGVNHVI